MAINYETEWKVRVVRLGDVKAHPNADKLELTEVDGLTCVVEKGRWKKNDVAVYVAVDSIVPLSAPEFGFLAEPGKDKTHVRVKAKKLRGIFSQGLLVPCRHSSWKVGKDVAEDLEVTKHDPEAAVEATRGPSSGGQQARGPKGVRAPVYGVENLRKSPDAIAAIDAFLCYDSGMSGVAPTYDGHKIVDVRFSEKIHGANARFYWDGTQLHVGSHRIWRQGPRTPTRVDRAFLAILSKCVQVIEMIALFFAQFGLPFFAPPTTVAAWLTKAANRMREKAASYRETKPDMWWRAAQKYGIEEALKHSPKNLVLYGEIFGPRVQKGYGYGIAPDDVGLVFFDACDPSSGERVSLPHEGFPHLPCRSRSLWEYLLSAEAERPISAPGFKVMDILLLLAEGDGATKKKPGTSWLHKGTPCEGIVIEILTERTSHKFKLVAESYLMAE